MVCSKFLKLRVSQSELSILNEVLPLPAVARVRQSSRDLQVMNECILTIMYSSLHFKQRRLPRELGWRGRGLEEGKI